MGPFLFRGAAVDRCAVFVDAGHLLAQAGILCCGSGTRGETTCAYEPLIGQIVREVEAHSGLPLLRVYWYDGAADGTPTLDHLKIGALRNVKLRLGRVIGARQKGVDALIYRDLMTLARERAMSTAYLVAGDDDLREGVMAAQEMGVRVILVGIPPVKGQNQSDFLIREADDHVVLEKEFWLPFFSSALLVGRPTEPPPPETAGTFAEAAAAFAVQWTDRATGEEIRRLLGLAPRVPTELDAQLLRHVQTQVGRELAPDVRREVRARFWRIVRERAEHLR